MLSTTHLALLTNQSQLTPALRAAYRGLPGQVSSEPTRSCPLRWHLLEQFDSSLLVYVSTWHAPGYLLTSEVEVVRDSWELGAVNGPLDPAQDDAAELVADVARWAQGETALYGDGL